MNLIINRLRIGHTRLTHSYLLSGDDQPTCNTCGHIHLQSVIYCCQHSSASSSRVGHTRLTHSYLLSSDDQPTCSSCGHPLTVLHILLDCVDLQDVRRRRFSVTCLKEICLKPSTIVLLLILSYFHPTFVVAFNSVYDTTVVLCTHLLIRKTILFIYLFT